jgi:hypothetical protein
MLQEFNTGEKEFVADPVLSASLVRSQSFTIAKQLAIVGFNPEFTKLVDHIRRYESTLPPICPAPVRNRERICTS